MTTFLAMLFGYRYWAPLVERVLVRLEDRWPHTPELTRGEIDERDGPGSYRGPYDYFFLWDRSLRLWQRTRALLRRDPVEIGFWKKRYGWMVYASWMDLGDPQPPQSYAHRNTFTV